MKRDVWVKGARKVPLYMAQLYTGLSNGEIEEKLGVIEASGISKAASRAKEEIASDKQLSKLVRELDSSFKV